MGTYPDGSMELVAFGNNQVLIQDCIRPAVSHSTEGIIIDAEWKPRLIERQVSERYPFPSVDPLK